MARRPGTQATWDILEDQGLALEKVRVLTELIADDVVDETQAITIACSILDALAMAEARRAAALDTLRTARHRRGDPDAEGIVTT